MFDTAVDRKYDRPLEYTPDKYLTADKKLPTIGYDPQIAVDIYGKGVLLAGLETIADSILRLLYTVPGNFPDYPEMGIDIRKYLFGFEDQFTANALREEILRQIPLLEIYISDNTKFTVTKMQWNNSPVVIIQLRSSVRLDNGQMVEQHMNIGITFDEFHRLTNDISFAFDGEETHFNLINNTQ
jgi:hypothetical protein